MKSVENNQICKTSKLIKWTGSIFLAYVLLCFISILMLFVCIESHQRDIVDMAMYLQPVWMLNPMVLVVSFWGLVTYLIEWRDVTKRECLGKKWIAFVLYSFISAIAWMVAGVCFVWLTGGV